MKTKKSFYRYYLEYPTNKDKRQGTRKNPGNHSGNCLAIPLDENGRPYWIPGGLTMDCYGAVYMWKNSDCAGTSAHVDYLREKCKRISEAQAREIHPRLFNYLEQ